MFGHPRPFPTPPISYRRLYMLPNRHGVLLGVLILVILLGAINYDNALAYLLCFLLGGLLLVGMLQGYHNLADLQLGEVEAMPTFAGGEAAFHLHLLDDGARPRHNVTISALVLEDRRWWLKDHRTAVVHLPVLEPGSEVILRVPAPHRGWQALGRLRLESHFPLGVLGGWAYLETRARTLVYPQPAGHLPLPEANLPAGQGERGNASGVEDFTGLHPYRPGESPRRIHWPSLAHQDELLVKRFSGNADRETALDWSAVAQLPGVEDKLSQLCQWVLQAEERGLRYSLSLPGMSPLTLGCGAIHRRAALEALARHGLE